MRNLTPIILFVLESVMINNRSYIFGSDNISLNIKRILYSTLALMMIAPLGAGLSTVPSVNADASRVHRVRRVHKQKSHYSKAELSFRSRIGKFGRSRKKYHHPTISWNARDFGGYRTIDGHYVKTDKLFRGGQLKSISKRGIKTANRLHINEIIDLRSPKWHSGVDHYPDPGEHHTRYRGLHVIYKVYPTNTDAEKSRYLNATKKYGENYCYGAPFVTYKSAIRSYRNVFHQLLTHKHGAIYIHCLEGHDRTGVTCALILKALGVPKRTIYNDFLITEYYQNKYPYVSQNAELNHFFRTIHKHYGSTDNYLRKAIGLKPYQIRKLRAMYLNK